MGTADRLATSADAQVLLDGSHTSKISIPQTNLQGAVAWTRDTLRVSDGLIKVNDTVIAELDSLEADLRANPLPVEAMYAADFHLPHSQVMMAQAKEVLEHGVGFVIIDRLPMERYSVDEARTVYWLLSPGGSFISGQIVRVNGGSVR